MHILIISPYPPPIGGNSVHVQRLLALLIASGHQVQVLDYQRASQSAIKDVLTLPKNYFLKLLKIFVLASDLPSDAVIHFHVSALGRFKWVAPLLIFLFGNCAKVITIHSGSFTRSTTGILWKAYLKWLLVKFQQIITVNSEQAEYLCELGIARDNITIIPAFLPQVADSKLIPDKVNQIPENKLLVITSGYLTPIYDYDILIFHFRI